MFHKALDITFLEGTQLQMAFQDESVERYDVAWLYPKYPQLEALDDRSLFTSGRLVESYDIIWNDFLDIATETIYQDGIDVEGTL